MADSLVFHVRDIEETMEALRRRGVEFPNGIEKSSTGPLAYFNDPDGHLLAIWQAPARHTPDQSIDFHPVLKRILNE